MKKPALWWGRSGCMGFDGIAVGVRWVMMLYAIFLHLFAMFLRYLNEIVCKITINLALMY